MDSFLEFCKTFSEIVSTLLLTTIVVIPIVVASSNLDNQDQIGKPVIFGLGIDVGVVMTVVVGTIIYYVVN